MQPIATAIPTVAPSSTPTALPTATPGEELCIETLEAVSITEEGAALQGEIVSGEAEAIGFVWDSMSHDIYEIMTFMPDPGNPGIRSVDGYTYPDGWNNWAAVHASASGNANGISTTASPGIFINSQGKYVLYRGVMTFDTSTLPDNATIISADISLYGTDHNDDFGDSVWNLYSHDTASGNELVAADAYVSNFGTTPYLETQITTGNWYDDDWNTFVLNSAGMELINPDGITRFSIREETHDVGNSAPMGSDQTCHITYDTADESGKEPRLEITYQVWSEENATIETGVGDSVDGTIRMMSSGGWMNSWSAVSGDYNGEFQTDINCGMSVSDTEQGIHRSLFVFDTDSLTEDIHITYAAVQLYGYSNKSNDIPNLYPEWNIYGVSTQYDDFLTLEDYNKTNFGATAFSSNISYDDWKTGDWNEFVLNESGRDHISTEGTTKFGVRECIYDAAGDFTGVTTSESPPTKHSIIQIVTEDSGSNAPRLYVEYYREEPGNTEYAYFWTDNSAAPYSGSFSHEISDLVPGTDYYFRAAGYQESGSDWIFGDELEFMTISNATETPTATATLTPTEVPTSTPTGNPNYGSPFNYNEGSSQANHTAALSADKFVVIFTDYGDSGPTAGYQRAVVGEVSGGNITFGQENIYNPCGTSYAGGGSGVAALDSSRFVIAYGRGDDTGLNDHSYVRVGNVISGNNISWGSEYEFYPGCYSDVVSVTVIALSTTKCVVFYQRSGSKSIYPLYAKVGNISGNAISLGSEYQITDYYMQGYIAVAALNSTRFVVGYERSDVYYGDRDVNLKIGNVSGQSITMGSEYPLASDNTTRDVRIGVLDSSTLVVTSKDDGADRARIAYVSGNSVSYNTPYSYTVNRMNLALSVLSSNTFVLSYWDSPASAVKSTVGSISGTTITFGAESVADEGFVGNISSAGLSATEIVVANQLGHVVYGILN